jgi:DNA-directed RNA polymerase specialized sigma24 family protein
VTHERVVAVQDQQDLELIWRTDGLRIWRAVAAYACDADVANDAVSEAFAQALARIDGIHDPVAWLWRTAFRLAVKELRTRRRTDEVAPEGAYDPPEPLYEVFRAFERLSATLGMSRATVRVHLSQGRRRLREMLKELEHE